MICRRAARSASVCSSPRESKREQPEREPGVAGCAATAGLRRARVEAAARARAQAAHARGAAAVGGRPARGTELALLARGDRAARLTVATGLAHQAQRTLRVGT